jgi:hypothetical protein
MHNRVQYPNVSIELQNQNLEYKIELQYYDQNLIELQYPNLEYKMEFLSIITWNKYKKKCDTLT